MHRYAQTNLQLYAQLGASGWSESQLGLVGRGYELAMEVCGASVRPNGKPFLCHLAGTASIVASWEAPRGEVVCGLLHSAYSHGVWADTRPGMTDAKRSVLRDAVGNECEALVAEYTQLAWSGAAVEALARRSDSLAAGERSAVRVRLANELEDRLDLGLQFSRKTKVAGSLRDDDPLLALAGQLVSHEFAQELAAAIAANAAGNVPTVLVRADKSSFRPASPKPRIRSRVKGLWSS